MPFSGIKRKIEAGSLSDSGCMACPLGRQEGDLFVPATIPGNPKLFIIGEAPGATEVKKREGFRGKSGKLLRRLLKEIFGSDEIIGFSNIAKCRPPENRNPSTAERKVCCKRYLFRELELLGDDCVIVCAGRVAAQALVGGLKRGSFGRWRRNPVMVTHHPAFCIEGRSPEAAEELRHDLETVKRFIDGERVSIDRKLVTDIDGLREAVEACAAVQYIGFDTETSGLDTFDPAFKLHTVAVAAGDRAWCIPFDHPEAKDHAFRAEALRAIQQILDASCTKVMWNAKFDLKVLCRAGFRLSIRKTRVVDAMLLAFLLNENRRTWRLKSFVSEHFAGYDDIPVDFRKVSLERLWKYNCLDAYYQLKLWLMFLDEASEQILEFFYDFLNPAVWVAVHIERNGVMVNKKRFRDMGRYLKGQARKTEAEIRRTCSAASGILLSSPEQVAKLLYGRLGYPVLSRTEKGQPSTGDEDLQKLARDHGCEVAPLILKLRTENVKRNNYYTGYGKRLSRDGRLHGNYKIWGTVTGRWSCENPNLMNIPRDEMMRSVFVPSEGNTFLSFDMSQIEVRIVAVLSRDPVMLETYRTGGDIHLRTASAVSGLSIDQITKVQRQSAKGMNFGFIYDMGAKRLRQYAWDAYKVDMLLDDAKAARKKWFKQYEYVGRWHKAVWEHVFKTGSIDSPLGRTRRHPMALEPGLRDHEKDDIFRHMLNAPIQGTASDLTVWIKHRMLQWIEKFKLSARVVLTLYDGFVIDLPESEVADLVAIVKDSTQELEDRLSWFDIPLVIDAEQGPSWGELVKVA